MGCCFSLKGTRRRSNNFICFKKWRETPCPDYSYVRVKRGAKASSISTCPTIDQKMQKDRENYLLPSPPMSHQWDHAHHLVGRMWMPEWEFWPVFSRQRDPDLLANIKDRYPSTITYTFHPYMAKVINSSLIVSLAGSVMMLRTWK